MRKEQQVKCEQGTRCGRQWAHPPAPEALLKSGWQWVRPQGSVASEEGAVRLALQGLGKLQAGFCCCPRRALRPSGWRGVAGGRAQGQRVRRTQAGGRESRLPPPTGPAVSVETPYWHGPTGSSWQSRNGFCKEPASASASVPLRDKRLATNVPCTWVGLQMQSRCPTSECSDHADAGLGMPVPE